jgi:bla regulator protein BlaR1
MITNTNFLDALGWAIIHSFWQMAALWVVYQLFCVIINKAVHSLKSSVAVALLITGFGCFIFTFIYIFNGLQSADPLAQVSLFSFENPIVNLNSIMPVVAVIYLSLLLLTVSRYIKNYRYVQVIKKYGLQKANAEWRLFVKKLSAQLGIRKQVQLWASEFVSSPVTIGWIKPIILIPVAALNNLSTQQAEALLLHELAHIKRYDYLLNLIINFIRTLLFFNPFVNAFVKITEVEREKSCDELVLQFQYPAYEYATALLEVQKLNAVQKVFALPATGRFDLLKRVEIILGVKKKKSFSFKTSLATAFAGMIIFVSFYFQGEKNKQTVYSYSYIGQTNTTPPPSFVTNKRLAFSMPQKKLVFPSSKSFTGSQEYTIADNIEEPVELPDGLPSSSGPYSSAAYEETANMPVIKEYQQQQVKEVIASSKRIIEDLQWKAIENDLAEVFTQVEKQELKKRYEKELGKLDWKSWEKKLNAVYTQIDWDKVNVQLKNAVNMVRIDSIQQVYSVALAKLDKAHKILEENSLNSIPDSDISAQLVEQKRKEATEVLRKINESLKKKIIQL